MSPRSRLRLPLSSAALAALITVLAAAPAGAGWVIFPSPVSPNGRRIYDLYELISIPAIIIFLFVEVALLLVIVRFRRRRPGHIPPQFHGNTRLELAWTAVPLVILLMIAAVSLVELRRDFVKPTNAVTSLDVRVTGRQFEWSYTYPKYGFTVSKDLYVPTGELVRLQVDATDVIHSWWVPSITGKTDAVPGYSNYTWLNISHPGKWHGECAELCGAGHYSMQTDVIAVSPGDFQAWVAKQMAKASKPSPSPSPSPKA
ncbi:MAG: cytochrome c oxidase subunit II [Candidatus Dormibacteraceae bacterium]